MLLVAPEATMREAAMAHATAVLPDTRARLYSFFMPVYNPVSARSCETVVKPLQKCTEMAFASNPVAPARPEAWLSFAFARAADFRLDDRSFEEYEENMVPAPSNLRRKQ